MTLQVKTVLQFIAYIVEKVKPERDGLAMANEQLARCNNHVAELLKSVTDLPEQIKLLEAELDSLIAEGKGTVTVEGKLDKLRAELNRIENWLDNKSDGFLADADIKQKRALSMLGQAVQRACGTVLDALKVRADAAMGELFGVFEDWESIVVGLRKSHLPAPMGKWLVNCGNFVSTFYTDRDKVARYSKMLESFPADIMKGKYIWQDKMTAERKAAEDAEAKKTEAYRKRVISTKATLAKQKAKEGQAEKLSPYGTSSKDILIDVTATEQDIQDMTKEAVADSIAKELISRGYERKPETVKV